MKAIRLIAAFIAMTFVSSVLACGNANVSTSDQDAREKAARIANSTLIQTASAETASSATAAR